ncbi:SDR family NAD(P)-dependent oxidoreductase [Umezawaea beigongshangensis]|uniref:SDR family NAD(P)-dependent oxidoreductase n=1 Tax=Umezawaea beigongshangensis TaxID=2780383 RepID=UPI0027DBEFBC|nr:SDR family NAD(P)-dependent oxidoreductase [Umezawaea beigongshangensis]
MTTSTSSTSPRGSGRDKPLAVVTGASSGIGLELARVFADNGFDLVVAAEDDRIHDVVPDLVERGALVEAVKVDLGAFEGVERLVGAVQRDGEPPEAVAINAGIGVGGDFTRDTELEEHLRLVNLNVTSAVHLAKRVLPGMVERGSGRVLFTSSIAATGPGPFQSTYAASKAFLSSFAEALREELKDTGVTVTALMPGPTDTDFFRRADMEDTRVGTGPKDDAATVAREGFDALMAGKDKVVAGGLKNRVQAAASQLLPDAVGAKGQKQMTEPGSGD